MPDEDEKGDMGRGQIPSARRYTLAVFLVLLVAIAASAARAEEHKGEGKLSPEISILIYQLQDDDPGRRYLAAAALIQLKPVPSEALARMLKYPLDPSVEKAFIEAGPRAVPLLTAAMNDSDYPIMRTDAVNLLGTMARRWPSLWPVVIGTFKNEDLGVRRQAASQFANLSKTDQKLVIPLLRAALRDDDPGTRLLALNAVYNLDPMKRDATPEVTTLLKDSDPQIRSTAAIVLMEISPPAKSAVGSLLLALKDPVREVRNSAASALVEIDPHHREILPILIENMAPNADPYLRVNIVNDFGAMGSYAQDAVPLMKHLLATDPDPSVRIAVAENLAKVSGKKAAALPLAQALTNDKDVEVRKAALKAIAYLGDDGVAAIPALIASLGDQNDDLRSGIKDDLASLGKLSIPALIAALHNPNFKIREGAVEAFTEIPLPDDAVHALTATAFKDKSRSVRNAAATVLQNAKIEAGDAALAQLEKDYPGGPHPAKAFDKDREYSEEEIIATVPADDDHSYPLRLVSLLPIAFARVASPGADILVTLHQGRDRPDRLVIWRKVGVNSYRILRVVEPDEDLQDEKFRPPTLLTPKDQPPEEDVRFLYIVKDGWRYVGETVFAIDSDDEEVRPVTIQSEPGPEAKAPRTEGNSTTSEDGFVELDTGTYKIIKETEPTGRVEKPFVNSWKFVPATATRKAPPG